MSEELSRVEDLLENGVEEPVLPMSELEAILRGEKVKPHSRVAELLLQYNPSDILIEKSITENGTYYASVDNADGYFKVIVDTPVVPPTVLDHLVETITENGTYNYNPEHDGYSDAEITVNVPKPQPVVASKTITANGTYVAADEQLDGYSQAVVNVPSVQPTLITKTITENGTYEAGDDNADGYSSVAVDVPQIGIKDIPNTPTSIAYFADGTANPLKSLTASIVPVQDLHGYDSPWAGGAGKNKCPINSGTITVGDFVTFDTPLPSGTYSFSLKATRTPSSNAYASLQLYDANGNAYSTVIGISVDKLNGSTYKAEGINLNNGLSKIYIYSIAGNWSDSRNYTLSISDLQIEQGSTATSYAPYSNICPISGWTEEVISVSPNKLIGAEWKDGYFINSNGNEQANNLYRYTVNMIEVKPSTKYYIQINYTSNTELAITVPFYDEDGNFIRRDMVATIPTQGIIGTEFTTPDNCYSIRISIPLYSNGENLQKGTSIVDGTTTTIPFTDGQGQSVEVFSGSVDVTSGVLTDDRKFYEDLKNVTFELSANDQYYWSRSTTIPYALNLTDGLCSHFKFGSSNDVWCGTSDATGHYILFIKANVDSALSISSVAEFNTWLANQSANGTPVQLCYKLATPNAPIQQQPTSIKSLDGVNNVFASTGQILSGQYFGYVYPELGTKTITTNGTYDPTDDNLDGYSEVNVTVPLGTKTITENGTYTATDDNLDGYSEVTINVAGGGGETKYYEYIRALNGQIIVRVEYPDAERTYAKQTLWFFNGYDTDSTDKDIPSVLIPYLPKNWSTDVMMTSGYTDDTSSTQLGWVGFLYPNQTPPSTKIRTWNIGKGGLQSGSFWGVLDISGEETQITEWFDPYEGIQPSQTNILTNAPIQNDQGNWITYNFDTPLTVGKSYLIMWSSGKPVDTHPFATAFTLVNSSENVSLTAHGVTATLSISTTSLVGTYSNDYDTRLRHINLLEIPSIFSDGLIY